MSGSPTPNQFNNIPTITGEDGEIIMRGRIKTAQDLVSCYWTLHTADWQSSRQRALYQSMLDGAPPYSDGKDRNAGIHGRVNVNWGFAAQAQEEAEGPYNDILDSLDTFGDIPTDYGDDQARETYGTIISEEMTLMLKNWEDFFPNWQQNVRLFVAEGPSFAFFEDEKDWRWKIYGMQFLKFPRRIQANVNKIDIITCKVDMLPHELMRKIEMPDIAKETGWDPSAVEAAVRDTCSQHTLSTQDPQMWQQAWKDNDINLGTTVSCVETIHGWVREVDGTVSQYISRYDGQGEFLYKCEGKHKAMSSLMFAYLYGIGSNGDFQSVRGLGQKLFSPAGCLNRLICKSVDMSIHSATPYLQCDNEDAGNENAVRNQGPYAVIQAGYQFPEKEAPQYAQALIPAIDQIQQIYRGRAAMYAPVQAGSTDRTQKTAKQVEIDSAQEGRLSSAGMSLFFATWKRHYKEIVRRVCREDYSAAEPGGQEVWEFRKRCLKRGVPMAAIYAVDVDRIEINTGIGKGSIAEKRSVLSTIMRVYRPNLEPGSQRKLDHDGIAALAGVRYADMLVPAQPGLQPPIDTQVANMENQIMALGGQATIEPNQNHAVHVGIHLQELSQINGALTNQQMEMEPAVNQMFPIWQHAGQHMRFLDPNNPQTKQYKEALEQLGEVIINGKKHIEAEQQRAQKEQQDQAGQQQGQPTSPDELVQAAQAQYQLQKSGIEIAKGQQELTHQKMSNEQELAFKQAKYQQELQDQALKNQQKPTGE